jgi:hypothetical protein
MQRTRSSSLLHSAQDISASTAPQCGGAADAGAGSSHLISAASTSMKEAPVTTNLTAPTTAAKSGLAALAVAGVLDFFQLLVLGSPDEPPIAVLLTTCGLGVVTLLGVAAAWRGNRAGLLVAVAARILDALLGIPAYVLGAPAWAIALIATMLILSIAGIVLVAPGLRRGKTKAVAS